MIILIAIILIIFKNILSYLIIFTFRVLMHAALQLSRVRCDFQINLDIFDKYCGILSPLFAFYIIKSENAIQLKKKVILNYSCSCDLGPGTGTGGLTPVPASSGTHRHRPALTGTDKHRTGTGLVRVLVNRIFINK